ncbi:hypothetical protein EJB05_28682, partial [Eragrostis curvula]
MEDNTMVLIVGAGPAGLATAACLTQLSIPYCIPMAKTLKQHLAKEFCELPHMSYPADAPTYIPKGQFVKYLEHYIDQFNIRPKYCTSIESCKYDEGAKFWFSLARNMNTSTIVKYTYCSAWERQETWFLCFILISCCNAHTVCAAHGGQT